MGKVVTNSAQVQPASYFSFAEADQLSSTDELEIFNQSDLDAVAQKALRVLLSQQPLTHTVLRTAVLGAAQLDHPSKCMFELAILSLIEHNILARAGIGSWAIYTVPDTEYSRAEALAFTEFPADDSHLMFTLKQLGTRVPCVVNPLAVRRNPSPRGGSGTCVRMGTTRGVEKASSRSTRGKRSLGSEELTQQLQKKFKLSSGSAVGAASSHAAAPMQLSP